MIAPTNPRSITPEEHLWLDVWTPEVQHQVTRAVADRYAMQIALGMAGYLNARFSGEPAAIVDNATKARYRKILRELAEDGVSPGPKKNEGDPPIIIVLRRSAGQRSEGFEYSDSSSRFSLVRNTAASSSGAGPTRASEGLLTRALCVSRAA